MKKVLNLFTRPGEDKGDSTTYVFKEPTLNPPSGVMPQSLRSAVKQKDITEPAPNIPADYAGIVEFFHRTVSSRKSPYNALVKSADRLKEFIPDEISRLKAAFAICGDQWPADVLSLAINSHISDIDNARAKAKNNKHSIATERAVILRGEADQLKEKNSKILDEINILKEKIHKLDETMNANNASLSSLTEQIQLAEADANSDSFLDQAAENIKNDLLAKKVILGLP